MLVLLTFNKGKMVFHFEWGFPVKNLKHMNHLKTLTMVSMETKVVSRDSFLTIFQKKFTRMDSEKGNRVFVRGAQCAPPWFLEPKKSLVWIGLRMGRTGPGRLCVIFSRGNCFALVPVLSGVEEDICKLDRIEGEFERDVRPIRRRGGRSVKYFCPFKTFHALAWMWPLCLVERERWRRWTQVLLSMVTPLLSKWRSAEVSL